MVNRICKDYISIKKRGLAIILIIYSMLLKLQAQFIEVINTISSESIYKLSKKGIFVREIYFKGK